MVFKLYSVSIMFNKIVVNYDERKVSEIKKGDCCVAISISTSNVYY